MLMPAMWNDNYVSPSGVYVVSCPKYT